MTFPYTHYGIKPPEPDENFRLLITGDRYWSDKERIVEILRDFDPKQTIVSHGGARGADTLAGIVADEMGMQIMVFNADWSKYGRRAGPVRNNHMLVTTDPHLVIAFHDDLGKSKGTAHMVKEALDMGYLVMQVGTKRETPVV